MTMAKPAARLLLSGLLALTLPLARSADAQAQPAPLAAAASEAESAGSRLRIPIADLNLAAAPAEERLDSRQLLAIGAGAIAAVVAFNILTAPLGTVPLAGGGLQAVPYSVALGSRLIAVTTAGAGALGALWVYDQWTGHKSDYAYALSLGAGALAGVAIGNWLTAGIIGSPPYYAGAGIADAAGAAASTAAQAASRVYVIGSGVLGAWAADWIYRRSAADGSP
jgi:hypothetical protein